MFSASPSGFSRRSLLGLLLLLLAGPGLVRAQEAPDPDPERMQVYARTFQAVSEVREVYFAELAATHDPEGKERVRHELDRELEEVLEAHGMPAEEFDELTFLVSTDPAYQSAFQEAMATIDG